MSIPLTYSKAPLRSTYVKQSIESPTPSLRFEDMSCMFRVAAFYACPEKMFLIYNNKVEYWSQELLNPKKQTMNVALTSITKDTDKYQSQQTYYRISNWQTIPGPASAMLPNQMCNTRWKVSLPVGDTRRQNFNFLFFKKKKNVQSEMNKEKQFKGEINCILYPKEDTWYWHFTTSISVYMTHFPFSKPFKRLNTFHK